jgi:hypothetical protein
MKASQNLKQILIFIILVLGLSYLVFWGPIAFLKLRTANLVEGKVYNLTAFIFFLIGGFVPSIVGIFLTKIYDRKSGLKHLLKSAIDVKIGNQAFVIIIAYPIIVGTLQLIINSLSGGSFDYSQFIKQLPAIIPLIILGPLSEEFGWRGFLQKRVNNEFSPILGSIVIGITWSLWHLPLFFMLGTSQHDFNIPFFPFMVAVTSSSFIYTYIYIKSNESLFSALMLHWVGTYIMQVIASQVTRTLVYNYLECLPALLIGVLFIFILQKHRTKNLTKNYASSHGQYG